MKNLFILLVFILTVQWLPAQLTDDTSVSIAAENAKNHVGESVFVTGTISVIIVSRQTTNVYLYLDGNLKNAIFAAVWPGTNDPPVKLLQNLISNQDPFSVSGKIIAEKNLPEIVVSSWSQIKR